MTTARRRIEQVALAGQEVIRAALGVLRQRQASDAVQQVDGVLLDQDALFHLLARHLEVDAEDFLRGELADVGLGAHGEGVVLQSRKDGFLFVRALLLGDDFFDLGRAELVVDLHGLSHQLADGRAAEFDVTHGRPPVAWRAP
ncbi:hypothetical protein D9M68_862150 [compost metagenome]